MCQAKNGLKLFNFIGWPFWIGLMCTFEKHPLHKLLIDFFYAFIWMECCVVYCAIFFWCLIIVLLLFSTRKQQLFPNRCTFSTALSWAGIRPSHGKPSGIDDANNLAKLVMRLISHGIRFEVVTSYSYWKSNNNKNARSVQKWNTNQTKKTKTKSLKLLPSQCIWIIFKEFVCYNVAASSLSLFKKTIISTIKFSFMFCWVISKPNNLYL